MANLSRRHQSPVIAQMHRAAHKQVLIALGADGRGCRKRQIIDQMRVRRGHRSKIANGGVIGPLGVIYPGDHPWHQKAKVGIALPMRVGGAVDRHIVDKIGEIRTMIKVIAADQILLRLAFARMDGDHKAGNALVELARAVDLPQGHFLLADAALAGGGGGAQHIGARGGDDDSRTVTGRGGGFGMRYRA